MEDQYLNLPPEYQAQIRELERKRQMAQMLQQQSMQVRPTEFVGNRAVKQSPLLGIAQVLSGYLGNKMGTEAGTGIADTLGKYQKAGDAQIAEYAKNPDQNGAMAEALANRDPRIQAWGKSMSALAHQQAQTADLQRKQTPPPVVSSPGQIGRDPLDLSKILFQNPEKSVADKALPAAIQEYEYAQGQGYKGSFQQFQTDLKKAGASSTSVSYGAPTIGIDEKTGKQVFWQPGNKEGAQPKIVGGLVPPPKASEHPGVEEGKIAAYASQMQSAEQELAKNPIPSTLAGQIKVGIAASKYRALAGTEAQQANQAKQQWAEAFLRFKTGAAAPEVEVERNIATFFPQTGETDPKIIAQKQRMRENAFRDVSAASGRAQGRIPKADAAPAPAVSGKVLRYNPATGALE